MYFRSTIYAAVAVFGIIAAQLPASAHPHKTTVDRVDFHGWHDAYRISNGIVDVVVVPSIGRIMQYCFTGHPETSPIWINPAEEGKPAGKEWINFGGDKVWPAPQGDWGKYMHQDRNWPPDPAIDPGHYTLTRIKDGVRLTGAPSKAFGISILRQIVLEPDSPEVGITDKFVRPKGSAAPNIPIAVWEVTQTKGDEVVSLPYNPQSKYVKGGFVAIDEGKPKLTFHGTNWSIGKKYLTVTSKGLKRGDKVGVDDNAGYLVEHDSAGIWFVEYFEYTAGGDYLDNGTDAQVYANDNPPYLEIESLGAGRKLAPGHIMSRHITWSLNRPTDPSVGKYGGG